MKIALPLTASDEFSAHYGAAAKFTVYDVDPAHRTVRRRLIVVPHASEPCAWPTLLQAAGVDLVLAGGMGAGARARMAEHGLKVLTGVPAAAPDTLVEAWMAGSLTTGENACDGSGQGGHHHGTHEHGGPCHCAH
jgi:predicted Fe-Mo cluster-binding NifX family protein